MDSNRYKTPCLCGMKRDPITGRCTANPSCDDFKRRPLMRRVQPDPDQVRHPGNLVEQARAGERKAIPALAMGVAERTARARRGWRTRRAGS